MKKCLSVVLSVILMLLCTFSSYAQAGLKGDIDEDGRISVLDARRVLIIVAELEHMPLEQQMKYDVNGDNKLTTMDARWLLMMAAELKPVIPNEEEIPKEEPQETTEERFAQIVAEEFVKLLNAERERVGVKALTVNDILTGGATVRAEECIEKFSHTRPNGKSFEDVLQGEYKYNYAEIGENIAYIWDYYKSADLEKNFTEQDLKVIAKEFFKMFKNSSVHYKNMTRAQYTEMGFGVSFYVNESKGTITVACSNLFGRPA